MPTPVGTPQAVDSATLTITGSGTVCGPWWFGCGAVLVIEDPGWTLPAGWTPDADDVVFDIKLQAGSDHPAPITGIIGSGPGRIEPGDYLLAGILTMNPDSPGDSGRRASIGCDAVLTVPPGTRSVTVALVFRNACSITVSMDPPTPS